MCGFFITNFPVKEDNIGVIESGLRFRGPDYSSPLVRHQGWTAYHARLAIIDLSPQTNQPMFDEKGGMLVFNGEILNYKALGHKYFQKEFTSDTVLLSQLLVSQKLKLEELDGFFSFVYIDKKGSLSHAARDLFGVKPLFYYQEDEHIAFSSEPIVLKNLFSLKTNTDAVEEYYLTRAPIFSDSYFDGISAVKPGNCLVNGQYFDCLEYIKTGYEEKSLNDVKEAVLNGVKTRLVSDAPVGLLLSRGIDSNLTKAFGNFSRYYTIGFEGDEDLKYLNSQSIPNLLGYECSTEEYKSAFEYLLNLRGEPMSVPNEVLLYIISKKAAEDGIKVLLSGEGADEFFGGYDRIFRWGANDEPFCVQTFLDYYCYSAPTPDSRVFKDFVKLFDSVSELEKFEKIRWFFIRYHMPILFRRLDFSLMAAGIEGREPLANLHTFLVAICFDKADLMNDSVGKLPLRQLAQTVLGKKFAFEQKVGFPVDLTKIFAQENIENKNSYGIWFEQNLKVLK